MHIQQSGFYQEESEEVGVEGTADRLRRVKLIKSLFLLNACIV